MSYIENIATLNTRRLNVVTKGIVNDFTDFDTTNQMILSSMVIRKTRLDQTYVSLIENGDKKKFIPYSQRCNHRFNCTIQQIKSEYSGVVFVLYFSDVAAIYQVNRAELKYLPTYCTKQHKDNHNEAQFTVNNKNIDFFEDYLVRLVSYNSIIGKKEESYYD